MKVCLVWTERARLVDISVRYERYVRGFRALGYDPITVCLPEAAEGYLEPVVTASSEADLCDPAYWRALAPDAAVIVSWLGLPAVVAALRQACPWVVALADSDGQIGVRAHPLATFRRMTAQHGSWNLKLRAAGFWLRLGLSGRNEYDRTTLESVEHSHRVVVCSPAAVGHLQRFFQHYRRPDLGAKVVSLPYPVDERYLSGPLPTERRNRVVAIGRWDDPQKDAGLLCRTIARYAAVDGRTEFLLVGPNGESCFLGLTRRFPQVRYLGVQGPDAVAEHLRESRVLLLPSRWESGPIVVHEALASGCTVVGTDRVPSVVSACATGSFGQVSRPTTSALAGSLARELAAWDGGQRSPPAIAAHWRPQVEPATVCGALLEESR